VQYNNNNNNNNNIVNTNTRCATKTTSSRGGGGASVAPLSTRVRNSKVFGNAYYIHIRICVGGDGGGGGGGGSCGARPDSQNAAR